MGENMSRRGRAWLALLLAVALALGGVTALAETVLTSFTFDLSATTPADAASAFAPAETGDDALRATGGMIDIDGETPAGTAEAAETVEAAGAEDETGDLADFGEDDAGATWEAEPDDPDNFSGPAPEEEPETEDAEAYEADEAEEPAATPTPTPTKKPAKKPVEITITAAGDTTLGGCTRNRTNVKFANVAKKKGASWFLGGVKKIFRNDDLTILNLEGPLTTAKQKRKGQYYFFKGSPAYVKILTAGSVEICNVANNHALDYGAAGLKQTASVLKKAGIGVSGYDVRYTTTVKGVKVCSLGFTKWDHTAADIRKAVKAARKKCDLLIVSVHWGWEKAVKPDAQQKAMGHAAVDAGADLVIGTHSHVYGGIEKYRGKYIIYSLGNFCFGGNPNPTDKRCLIFQQTFHFDPASGISDAGINIIPAKVSSSKKTNDYRPTLMGRAEGVKLLKAVAKVSKGISPKNTLWTKSNYLVWSGIVSQKKLNALNARVKRSRAKATKKKTKKKSAVSAAAMFADETDASLAEDLTDLDDDVVIEEDVSAEADGTGAEDAPAADANAEAADDVWADFDSGGEDADAGDTDS